MWFQHEVNYKCMHACMYACVPCPNKGWFILQIHTIFIIIHVYTCGTGEPNGSGFNMQFKYVPCPNESWLILLARFRSESDKGSMKVVHRQNSW